MTEKNRFIHIIPLFIQNGNKKQVHFFCMHVHTHAWTHTHKDEIRLNYVIAFVLNFITVYVNSDEKTIELRQKFLIQSFTAERVKCVWVPFL